MPPKGKTAKPAKKKKAAEDKCHHCGKIGHWRRNCPDYIASVRRERASASGMFIFPVIDISLACEAISSGWVLDSACPTHICNTLQGLRVSRMLDPGEMQLRFGNGDSLSAAAVGEYEIRLSRGSIILTDCVFVPGCVANIISLFVLDTKGYHVHIQNRSMYIYDMDDFLLHKCSNLHGHYILYAIRDVYDIGNNKHKRSDITDTELWHMRLGHIGVRRLTQLVKNGLIENLTVTPYLTCESCIQGKMTKAPFTGVGHRATDLLELVHSDVCGPISHTAHSGYSYFVTFTDDLSRYGYVYLIKHKSETFERNKEFHNEIDKQTGECLRSN